MNVLSPLSEAFCEDWRRDEERERLFRLGRVVARAGVGSEGCSSSGAVVRRRLGTGGGQIELGKSKGSGWGVEGCAEKVEERRN